MSNQNMFHQSRIAFAIINHKLVHTMFDKRSHKEWLQEQYNMSESEYENTLRGYMKDGKVFFYRTSEFTPINMDEVGIDSLNHIQILSMVYMNTYNPECFNGMNIGEEGTVWEPISNLGSIQDIIGLKKRSLGARAYA